MNLAPSRIGATVCWSNIFALCFSLFLFGICAYVTVTWTVAVCVYWQCNGHCKSMRNCMFVCEFTTKFILSTTIICEHEPFVDSSPVFTMSAFIITHFRWSKPIHTQAQSMLCSASWSTSRAFTYNMYTCRCICICIYTYVVHSCNILMLMLCDTV